MIQTAEISEARSFLEQNPDIKSIDLLIADLNGIFRGKRIYPEALDHVFEDGILLAKSLFASDITGATSEYSKIGLRTGDMDSVCVPVAGTLCRVPWKTRPAAQLQMVMQEPRSTPFEGDPQTIVDNLTLRFREMNLPPVVAISLEFYLIEHDGKTLSPRLRRIPGSDLPQDGLQFASLEDLAEIDPFLNELTQVCKLQNIPVGAALSEYSPGQFEVNLQHVDDPVLACDHAVLLKRAVKAVARKHGLAATFMAKPFAGIAGSGMHVHMSLLDDEGNNVFAG